MMDLFRGLTDDQLALLGCVIALAGCAAVLSASYVIGRVVRGRADVAREESITIRMADHAGPAAAGRGEEARRKAA